jgi:hypothetical protein
MIAMIGVPFLATAICWLLPSPPGDWSALIRAPRQIGSN